MAALSPLESAFLQLESPTAPMHLASIAIFEAAPLLDEHGELRLAELRALITSRLHLVPKLRQRPTPGLLREAPPTWSDDPTFDIANHVQHQRLPGGGDDAQLLTRCGNILAEPLDPGRPLWELIFLTGLEHGRVALVEKLHHALADGVAAAELATVLLDVSPKVPERSGSAPWEPTVLAPLQQAVRDLSELAKIWFRLPLGLAEAALHPIRTARTALEFTGAVLPMLPVRLIAPRTSLNSQISSRREVHVLRTRLEDIRTIAHAHEATINDVLLAAVSGGLRSLLEVRGELGRVTELQALVPVGLNPQGKRTTGNGVSAYFVRLPVSEEDPERALAMVSNETRSQKERHEEIVPATALNLLEPVPQSVLGDATRLLRKQPFFNVIVTNVPGPPVPLYALGARMLEAFPIVPLLGNQGLGVAALSYLDALDIGVLSNPDVCPDVVDFCQGAMSTLDELGSSVRVPTDGLPHPTRLLVEPEQV